MFFGEAQGEGVNAQGDTTFGFPLLNECDSRLFSSMCNNILSVQLFGKPVGKRTEQKNQVTPYLITFKLVCLTHVMTLKDYDSY